VVVVVVVAALVVAAVATIGFLTLCANSRAIESITELAQTDKSKWKETIQR
jgi:hypothetical protein